jgi:thiamine-monophosphate kinase
MALNEFQLIERYFDDPTLMPESSVSTVVVGIGDDGAVLDPPPGKQLVMVVDTLVSGVHFPADLEPGAIGYRALAVNLSDLAAMGAQPLWFTLALTLPEVNESWLSGYAGGLSRLAQQHGIALVGGDTTRGPLSMTVQACGFVEPGTALTRGGAQAGDRIYLTGSPGEAAAGLAIQQGRLPAASHEAARLRERFNYPEPRTGFGRGLAGIASAAIDVSDGLLADLGHICQQSGLGAMLYMDRLPLSDAVLKVCDNRQAIDFLLRGGDDYELCFTVPGEKAALINELADEKGIPCHCIGEMVAGERVRCLDQQGKEMEVASPGYDHFTD